MSEDREVVRHDRSCHFARRVVKEGVHTQLVDVSGEEGLGGGEKEKALTNLYSYFTGRARSVPCPTISKQEAK